MKSIKTLLIAVTLCSMTLPALADTNQPDPGNGDYYIVRFYDQQDTQHKHELGKAGAGFTKSDDFVKRGNEGLIKAQNLPQEPYEKERKIIGVCNPHALNGDPVTGKGFRFECGYWENGEHAPP